MKHFYFIIFLFSIPSHLLSQEDHTDFIEGPFESPQEITATCLDCHDGIEADIMKSRHWNWLNDQNQDTAKLSSSRGKVNLINNFCIGVPSNWPRCTSCHIGYGWEDSSFDFNDPFNIDCLICHDQTGTYTKLPAGGGMPSPEVNLEKVAQSVGPTKRKNCGGCHFNGGGGTGVKHGDLDESLIDPSEDIDIHMGVLEFECTECHYKGDHQIIGASHGSMAEGDNHIYCADCHAEDPHSKEILNSHGKSIACETCHIPKVAKEIPTKVWWDWSKAGSDNESATDELGMQTYSKKKGEFRWEKDLIPQYSWYDGSADYYAIGDKIESEEVVYLNSPNGNNKDPGSKITPFKVMEGKQIYDATNNYMVIPKLYGEGGYWQTYDWGSAAKLGMESVDLDFSGNYEFINTKMYWPINHMVASAENALRCTACHGTKGTKLLDWDALGYNKDPLKSGSRFK
jgi:octaheme c-type cytochrome (tetrathionate reductase family)